MRRSLTDREIVETRRPALPRGTQQVSGFIEESGGLYIDPETGELASQEVPQNFRIVKQEASFSPDGTMVVDVTIEWNDVSGALSYDVRYSKVTDGSV